MVVEIVVTLVVFVGAVLCAWYFIERSTDKSRLAHMNSHLSIYCSMQKDITAWELAYIVERGINHAHWCSFDDWDNIPSDVKRHIVIERDPRIHPYTKEEAKI